MRANLVRLPEPVGWLITRAEAGAVISLFVAAVGFYGAIKLVSQGSQDGHSPWDDNDVGTAIVISFIGLTLLLLGSLFPLVIYARTKYSYDGACHLLFFAGAMCLFAVYESSWNHRWRLEIYKFTMLQAFTAYAEGYLCARTLDVFDANAAAATAAAANAAPASAIEMGAQSESGTGPNVV